MLEQQKIQGMSLEDFMTKYEEQPFELIDGHAHILMPTIYGISTIQKNIYLKFLLYTQNTQVGKVYGWLPIVMLDDLESVKSVYKPSVAFFQHTRLNKYYESVEDYNEKPLMLVPDIVVEIMWSFNPHSHVKRKVHAYLEDGVKLIWVVDYQNKTVVEYTQDHPDGVAKRKDDVLSGGDVAQGFELAVSEIFE